MEILNIAKITGKVMCIDPNAGEEVYERALSLLQEGKHVDISFSGVTTVITAFLNVAIGKLCNPSVLDPQKFDELLTFSDATDDQMIKIKQVIKTAKKFYHNPQEFKEIYSEAE